MLFPLGKYYRNKRCYSRWFYAAIVNAATKIPFHTFVDSSTVNLPSIGLTWYIIYNDYLMRLYLLAIHKPSAALCYAPG